MHVLYIHRLRSICLVVLIECDRPKQTEEQWDSSYKYTETHSYVLIYTLDGWPSRPSPTVPFRSTHKMMFDGQMLCSIWMCVFYSRVVLHFVEWTGFRSEDHYYTHMCNARARPMVEEHVKLNVRQILTVAFWLRCLGLIYRQCREGH